MRSSRGDVFDMAEFAASSARLLGFNIYHIGFDS